MSDLIHVLNKRVALAQAPEGFRTSMDSVFLAAACPAKPGQRVLDLGCGVGSAGLCVLRRVENVNLTGIDIQPEVVTLAEENATRNAVAAQTRFTCMDIRDFEGETFDHVICNPPFMEAGEHTPSPLPGKATAMGFGEDDMDLKDWVDCAFRNIQGTGSITIIHRADMLDDIILALGKRFGDTEAIPLWPKAGREAKRVIVRSRKHRKGGMKILPGLVLHHEDGSPTEQAEAVLRNVGGL